MSATLFAVFLTAFFATALLGLAALASASAEQTASVAPTPFIIIFDVEFFSLHPLLLRFFDKYLRGTSPFRQ